MAKKIIKKITTFLVLAFAFLPSFVWAQTTPIFSGGDDPEQEGVKGLGDALGTTGVTAESNLGDLILKYVNFALPYLALAAFLGFIYAGFLYVTAYGNDEQVQKSKKILIYAVAGLVLVMLSYSIVQLLTSDLVEGIGA
ncbi:pilin [Patescibacteria group bacterium]|nr:pilin [Patescibacteria group bacterium]